ISTTTNGRRHMAELIDATTAAGVPAPHARLSDFTAESGPDRLAEIFAEVTVTPYDDHLEVPAADLAVAYAARWCGDTPRPAALDRLRAHIQAVIDRDGHFRIDKQTVQITGRKLP